MQKPSQTRRRILKGAALTPAIYTLHSGAARAAASNLRCLKTRDRQEQPKKLFTLHKSSKWHTWKVNSRGVHLVQKVDVNQHNRHRDGFVEEDRDDTEEEETQFVSHAKSKLVAIVNYGPKGHRDAEGNKYKRKYLAGHFLFHRDGDYYKVVGRRSAYTYVYVDDHGRVKGTGPTSNKYMGVTNSCWHSVVPGKAQFFKKYG